MDGIRQVNNPDRVPSILESIEPNQAGAPRLIHPITMVVGSNERTDTVGIVTTMDAEHQFEVPEDGTFVNDQGDPFQFPAGHRLPLAVAAKFPAFRQELGDSVIPGTQNARAEPPVENRIEPPVERKAPEKAAADAAKSQGE